MARINKINRFGETWPVIIIDKETIEGYKFARMYINELTANIYDLLNGLNDKQLSSIVRMAKKYTDRNTTLLNFFQKDALINTASYILQKRKIERKNLNNH